MKKILLFVFVLMMAVTPTLAANNLSVATALGFAALKYQFTNDLSGYIGVNNFSGTTITNAPGTGIMLKVDYNLEKLGKVQPTAGLFYITNGVAAATTSMGATYGVETNIADNLVIGADFVLASSVANSGFTQTGILPAVAVKAALSL